MTDEAWPGDASSLIYLAKAAGFGDAARCVARILATPAVWREAVEEGQRIGAPEVSGILAAASGGFLVRVELTGQEEALAGSLAGDHRLGRGESEVLALGRRLGRAIVDEGRASRVAAALGIRRVSTLFLPVLGAQGRAMTRADAIAFLRRLALATGARAEAVYAIEEFLRRDP